MAIELSQEWYSLPKVKDILEVYTLSQNQKDLMTPVIINSANIAGLRRSFLELFKKTGVLFSPLSFRYSYSISVAGKREYTIIPKYYIEKDINMMLDKYKIVTHLDRLVPSNSKKELDVLDKLSYFDGDGNSTYHKLIKTTIEFDRFIGWEFKELFPDKPIL